MSNQSIVPVDFYKNEVPSFYKELEEGMPLAVAERTILRKKSDISRETWADVAERVALGNALLSPDKTKIHTEKQKLQDAIGKATLLLSGRHLQHGDKDQPKRNQEVFTNCSTAPSSFLLFYLLLNGSGVGRSYDDDMILTNWDYSPNLRCVLSDSHPDFDWSRHESSRDAKHKYGNSKNVMWHEVGDSREEWAKALELWENATFEKIHKDKLLILDFSKIRRKGSPIGGMQDRPASGPKELIDAFEKSAKLKGAGLEPWKQAMYIDHYFAECVLVGGARRAARMATKYWKDKSVCDFVMVKRPIELVGKTPEEIIEIKKTQNPMGFLWSSNNSVTVDADFWAYINGEKDDNKDLKTHAVKVFNAVCEASYFDGTGEPGLINVDKLTQKDEGYKELLAGNYVGSKKFQVNEDTHLYLSKLAKRARGKQFTQITNPCQNASAPVLTKNGISTFGLLKEGDQIWSETGWTKVKKKWSTGIKKVYKYTTSSGVFFGTENHRIVSGGEKIEVGQADSIDSLAGPFDSQVNFDSQDIMDGLVLGDGTVHDANNQKVLLHIGEDDFDYFSSEISDLIIKRYYPDESTTAYVINSTISKEELGKTFTRTVPDRFFYGEKNKVCSFLRGLYSANGSLCDTRVTLKTSSPALRERVQIMLSSLGIKSYFTTNKEKNVKFSNGDYLCKESYDINITGDKDKFYKLIGFIQKYKTEKLEALLGRPKPYKSAKITFDIKSVEFISEEEVFDITVDNDSHTYWTGGVNVSNCGEISLTTVGGFCVIADIVPFHADTLDEAEEVFRVATRALIRVNLMDSIYNKEVKRTNRIGVGITGIHEYAWKFFKLGFNDLIDENKSKDFWLSLARFNRAVKDEAESYCKELQVSVPHTLTTIKPAGTTSKLFLLTEGWHLPSMREFLRWVQFRNEDPLIKDYQDRGYPVRQLKSYNGTTIVGFPTAPMITRLGMGDKLVTAAEASPEDQYKWLMLGEKYWIHGTDNEGNPVNEKYGNQISYTLKYKPTVVGFEEFKNMMAKYQSKISCCSVMPQVDASAYEYQPEQPVSSEEYNEIIGKIRQTKEDLDFSHIDCAAGACPIDFKK
jgi:hypothetical protein